MNEESSKLGPRVVIDVREEHLTVIQIIAEIERLKVANPEKDYVFSGDAFAIVEQPRRK